LLLGAADSEYIDYGQALALEQEISVDPAMFPPEAEDAEDIPLTRATMAASLRISVLGRPKR